MLQTHKRLLHSTAENSDFNMAGYEFEAVRDMSVLSDCHPVERDQFQAPAPPSAQFTLKGKLCNFFGLIYLNITG